MDKKDKVKSFTYKADQDGCPVKLVNLSGQKRSDGSKIDIIELLVDSNAVGTKPSKPAAGATKWFADLFKLDWMIAGHILSERLGGPGWDEHNLVPKTRSLNLFYYNHFEKLLIDLKTRYVHVNLVGGSDEVRKEFDKLFVEEKVKVSSTPGPPLADAGQDQGESGMGGIESVYERNDDGGFTATFYHNPARKGQASIREDPNSQYEPGPEADAEFNKTANDMERELMAEMEALRLEESEGNSRGKMKAKKRRTDKEE